MTNDLTVVVTGAGGAIGAELSAGFHGRGDHVIATDSVQPGLDALRDRLGDDRLDTTVCDITDEEAVSQLATAARTGRVDVVVNCAGYFPIVKFEDMSVQDWRQVIEINLTGTFIVTRAMLPHMKERGWGRIVNFSSASIYEGAPGQVHYTAAKGGVMIFTRSLSMEVGQYGITVNAVSPGLTVTDSVRQHFPAQLLADQRRLRAIQRDEVPADLVGPVLFLASPAADFMSGQTLIVDGGRIK